MGGSPVLHIISGNSNIHNRHHSLLLAACTAQCPTNQAILVLIQMTQLSWYTDVNIWFSSTSKR